MHIVGAGLKGYLEAPRTVEGFLGAKVQDPNLRVLGPQDSVWA